MPTDQFGRWVPDYNYNNYREDLLKQREAIDYRLTEYDRRYQPQQTSSQTPQVSSNVSKTQFSNTPAQPYIIVASEQEARDYPIVNKIDDEIGKVHFFAMNDDSAIFAKRINPSTFDMEFEIYIKQAKAEKNDKLQNSNEDLFKNIDERLQKIEDIMNGALTMFINSGNLSSVADTSKPKSVNKPTSLILPGGGKGESEVQ